MLMKITLPEKLVERLKELGVEPEAYVIDSIASLLSLNPDEGVELHAELAERFLKEGEGIVDRDPVQASEKLYKAAEEAVKALALHLKLEDVVKKVQSKGRWTVTELERAVETISERIGAWFLSAWDTAWTLHVLGFHEAKLNSEAVKRRLQHVRKMVEEARKLTHAS